MIEFVQRKYKPEIIDVIKDGKTCGKIYIWSEDIYEFYPMNSVKISGNDHIKIGAKLNELNGVKND